MRVTRSTGAPAGNHAKRTATTIKSAAAIARRLFRFRMEYGRGAGATKLELLSALEIASLPRPADVARLHEVLCFLRAYPDDPDVLAQVERMLARFDRRRDVKRFREKLADSGIAGTPIDFRFFQPTASWLARKWGTFLRVDWKRFKHGPLLDRWLPLLTLYAETPGLDEFALDVKEWIDRMRGPNGTDAVFLIRRFDALRVDPFVREKLYDELDIPIRLDPGRGTPSRTHGRYVGPDVHDTETLRASAALTSVPRDVVAYQTRPLARSRPALPAEIYRPPIAVRDVAPPEADRLIDLAREAMVTRSRDLDVFSYADRNDVRLVDCGEGLQFVAIGAIPERRLLLEAVYGFLTLKNGVPIGYVLSSALFGSSEIAYNVFETYRGAEAGQVYGRVLATVHHLFGSAAFTIYPYQLGDDNKEALESGAWWFYQKMGFAPRDPVAIRIMRRELARMKKRPAHRSSIDTLRRLAASNLFYFAGKPREDVIGVLSLPEAGLKVTSYLAARFGSDRQRAARTCMREAARLLGVHSFRGFAPGERLAWERWAPLVMILPGVSRWSAAARRNLALVVRAKGGRRESDFVALFNRHRSLRRAIRALARGDDD